MAFRVPQIDDSTFQTSYVQPSSTWGLSAAGNLAVLSGTGRFDPSLLGTGTYNAGFFLRGDGAFDNTIAPPSGDAVLGLRNATNTGTNVIQFGDLANVNPGRIIYSHVQNWMEFWTNGTKSLQIELAGSLTSSSTVTNLGTFTTTNASASMGLRSAAAGLGTVTINFGDAASANVGRVVYNHSTDAMEFWTNGSVSTTIDSAGDVSSPSFTVTTNAGYQINDGTRAGYLNPSSGAGGIALMSTTSHPLFFGSANTIRGNVATTGDLLWSYPIGVTTGSSAGANVGLSLTPNGGALGRGAGIDFAATFNLAWGGADFVPRYSGRIAYLSNETVATPRNHRLAFFTNTNAGDTPTEGMSISTGGNFAAGISSTSTHSVTGTRINFFSDAAGSSAMSQTSQGMLLYSQEMNTTSCFTPAIMFGSSDSAFTTVPTKVLAAIVGRAMQTYSTDTTGNMQLEFYTAAGGATTPSLTRAMALTYDNNAFFDGTIQFGSVSKQHITLWGAANEYGFGIQGNTLYHRSGSAYAWFKGGVHNNTQYNPGAGGTMQMSLDAGATLTVYGDSIALESSSNTIGLNIWSGNTGGGGFPEGFINFYSGGLKSLNGYIKFDHPSTTFTFHSVSSAQYSTFTSNLEVSRFLRVAQMEHLTVAASVAANLNNWNPMSGVNVSVIVATPTAAFAITGLVPTSTTKWQRVVLVNNSAFTLTLTNQSASSTAAYRFRCPNNVNYGILQYSAVELLYNVTTGFWIVLGSIA